MTADVKYFGSTLQNVAEQLGDLFLKLQINCNTNPALVTATCLNASAPTQLVPDGVAAYVKTTVQPTPLDPGANFPVLINNADPSTVGIVVHVRDAIEPVAISSTYITNTGVGAGNVLTSVDVELRGNGSVPGTTTSANLAFVLTCNGLNFTNSINTSTVWLICNYQRAQNQK